MQLACRRIDFACCYPRLGATLAVSTVAPARWTSAEELWRTILLTIPFLKGWQLVFPAARRSGLIRTWLLRPFALAYQSVLACSAMKPFAAPAHRPLPILPGLRWAVVVRSIL